MSAVIVLPELIAQAATDLTTIGSRLAAAHLTAAAPTQVVLPAAADEVSAGIAQLFSSFADDYQGLSSQVAAYHQQFIHQLGAAAGRYAGAEAGNVSLLRPAVGGAMALPAASLTDIFDSIINSLIPAAFQLLALLYYALFLLLIPIYAALAVYLPFAYLGSLFPG